MKLDDLDFRALLNGLRNAPEMDPELALRLASPEGTATADCEDKIELGGNEVDATGFRMPHDPVAARRYLLLACGGR